MGGQKFIGLSDGGAIGYGPYGFKPGQNGYEDTKRERTEAESLEKFKAEWAKLNGPEFKAQIASFALGGGVRIDSEEMTQERDKVRRRHNMRIRK